MKKMMMIAAMMIAAVSANAQNEVGQITLQPKAGINISTITGDYDDKKTGKQYSKIPMVYKVEYMELQKKGNVEKLFVVDYNESLYEYNVVNTPARRK